MNSVLEPFLRADERKDCPHPKCLPVFGPCPVDLPAHEVRRLYPRFEGVCPDCGAQVIAYASMEHYIAGDW